MVTIIKNESPLNSQWRTLYLAGGLAAAAMALFIPIQVIVFILWPPPGTVSGWFALFDSNRLIGLLDMDLLLIVDQVLMILIFLSLYTALRQSGKSVTAIALAFGLVGVATYFASTSAFEMLSLSAKYASAASEAEKGVILAAGEVMLVNWQGTAFDVSYVISGIALLLFAIVMVKSGVFGKLIAYLALVLGIMALLPPTVGVIGMAFALGSLLPLELFDILIARRFFLLSTV